MVSEIPTEPGFYESERYPVMSDEGNYMPYFLDREGRWWEVGEPGVEDHHYDVTDDIEWLLPMHPMKANYR